MKRKTRKANGKQPMQKNQPNFIGILCRSILRWRAVAGFLTIQIYVLTKQWDIYFAVS